MNIVSKVIPHTEQRYDTCGDWWFDENNDLQIRVSYMNNPYYEFLVSYHEQCEAMLCFARGIDEKDVMAFDEQFEKDRIQYQWGNEDEPGDDRLAPYRKEHFTATNIERIMASELKVDWKDYEDQAANV